MKKLKLTLLILVSLRLSTLKAESGEGIDFRYITLVEAKTIAQKENKLIFVDLYATWCGPCKYLTKKVFVDKELGEFYNKHFISLKIDGEKEEGIMLMSKYDLDSYPTLLYFDKTGKLIKKKVGAAGPQSIKQWGYDAIHPEETRLFMLKSIYEVGGYSKEFHADYIKALVEEDEEEEGTEVANKYLKENPKLNLKNENDFTAFVYSNLDLNNELTMLFLSNIQKYKTLYDNKTVRSKIYGIINIEIDRAVDSKDEKIIENLISMIYKPYKEIFKEDALKEDEFSEKINAIYKENLN